MSKAHVSKPEVEADTDSEKQGSGGMDYQRHAVKLKGTALFVMAFQTLGIIYSDIGTSPLYVLNGIWPPAAPAPSPEDVIGGISAIVWSLTLIPLVKYVCIALDFGTDEGEGGTFALYNGLFPARVYDEGDDRELTGDSVYRGRSSSGRGKILPKFKWYLFAWALFGTALTISDGILTPAVSVTSAVGGIAVSKPSVQSDITPISIAFLAALFLVQRFGTGKLAFLFAPITSFWFLLIGCSGIYNITKYPAIFRAFDPSRAVLYFVRTKDFDTLSGVLLAITGCEALFANLGQFNKRSIQISFISFVYPSLVLAYLGQGARLVVDGEAVINNVFYATIPGPAGGPLYWITYVWAIFATLIASQTMITAVFSLVQQLINLRSLPPLRIQHTSETYEGQVYIPVINYLLGAATVIVVAGFQSLQNLTNAYGFAVSTVMIVTTSLIAVQMPALKKLPWYLGVLFFLVFGFFDGLFWGSSLRKIPLGAYVPLAIGFVLWCTMYFWTWAKGLEDYFDGMNRKNLRQFIFIGDDRPEGNLHEGDVKIADSTAENLTTEIASSGSGNPGFANGFNERIQEEGSEPEKHKEETGPLYMKSEDGQYVQELTRIPTVAIFHKMAGGQGVPHSFYAFLKQWPALPRVVIFLNVRILPVARLPKGEDRHLVTRVRSLPGFYGVTYQLGYRDKFDVHVDEIIAAICATESHVGDPTIAEHVVGEIRQAAQTSLTHIMPNYWVYSIPIHAGFLTPVVQFIRSFLLEVVYRQVAIFFPDNVNWPDHQEETIRVGVNAGI